MEKFFLKLICALSCLTLSNMFAMSDGNVLPGNVKEDITRKLKHIFNLEIDNNPLKIAGLLHKYFNEVMPAVPDYRAPMVRPNEAYNNLNLAQKAAYKRFFDATLKSYLEKNDFYTKVKKFKFFSNVPFYNKNPQEFEDGLLTLKLLIDYTDLYTRPGQEADEDLKHDIGSAVETDNEVKLVDLMLIHPEISINFKYKGDTLPELVVKYRYKNPPAHLMAERDIWNLLKINPRVVWTGQEERQYSDWWDKHIVRP